MKKMSEIGEELVRDSGGSIEQHGAHARLLKQIDYAALRFHTYENERDKLLKTALTIVGFGSLSVTILNSPFFEGRELSRAFFICALTWALFVSFFIIGLFMYGTKRNYTHRKIADVKGWFFKYATKEIEIDMLDGDDTAAERITKGFSSFASSMIDVMKSKEMQIAEDLQQLYIMYIFQSISSSNHGKMMETFRWGILVFCVLLSVTLVLMTLGY